MRRLLPLAVLLFSLSTARPALAQRFGSQELDRVYQPGVLVPYDGAPYSHRYFYGTGGILYLNGSGRGMWYADYLDRFDRAVRFGYPIPRDPALAHAPRPCPGPNGVVVIDPANPLTDPADILPQPPLRGVIRR